MNILRKFGCVFLSLIILSLSALCSTETFMRVNAADIGYVDATNVNVRADASVNSKSYGQLSNVYVTINGQKTGDDGYIWYNITYNDITGYMRSDFIKKIEVQPDKNFEEQLAAFPESYRNQLIALHAAYPNWKFYADNIDLTLDEAAQLEIARKTYETPSKSWLSMDPGSYDWGSGEWVSNENGRWYYVSREVIKYYMDPRNFLNSSYIYTYMKQNYDPTSQTEEGLKKIVSGTFLEKGYSDPNDTAYGGSYIKVIMAAAQSSGVNPYILAGTIIQEQGPAGTSSIISGASGYYNFFNIGATGNTPITNGLAYAKSNGWTTRSKAIIEGAQFCGNSYVSAGQNTYFYMNYNIKEPDKIWHQYAEAVHNAAFSGYQVSKTYADLKYAELDFLIPVYKNMPDTVSALPEKSDKLNNYYFDSISVEGLTDTFSRFNYSYDLEISADTVVKVTMPSGAS
ncbi:MAG: N-acetylglucosaminidase, partial [Acutalibacteraceae bacterium]